MMQIIFLLLKIIGILLAVLLGLFLLITLAVLFIPVRYQFFGKRSKEEMSVRGKISWFLSLFSVSFGFEEKFFVQIRLFGLLWKKKDRRVTEESGDTDLRISSDAVLSAGNQQREEPAGDLMEQPEELSASKSEAADSADSPSSETVLQERDDSKNFLSVLWDKIKNVFRSLQQIPQKMQAVREKIRIAFRRLCRIKEKAESFLAFLKDEETKKVLRRIWRQIRRAVRHILPRTVRIRGRFGFSDPALTGQATGGLSMIPVFYRKDISLTPVFSEACLDGEFFIRGRIRGASLLWILVQVLLRSDFRKMLRRFQKIMAEDE